MNQIERAQGFLQQSHLDGWLLYDFHGSNELARHFLRIPSHEITTRRFFYWIPAKGEPVKLVHAIEPHVLDRLPGEKRTFLSWQSLEKEVGKVVQGAKKVAMEYSPKNAIPYVSRVDGGTIDLIRSFGVEVVSSADFLAHFTSVLTKEEGEGHQRAARACDQVMKEAWDWIVEKLKRGDPFTEYDIQQQILKEFASAHLVTDHAPIVAVNAHSADPHYEPLKKTASPIRKGDFILIDLWAREKGEETVFGDITRVAVAAPAPTAKQNEVFQIVRRAQKAAVQLIRNRFAKKQRIAGWEVDQAARNEIEKAGFGPFFIHRTGHNIGFTLHGSGAHMDNLEMHDIRPLLPGTCFSIEPGIYLPGEFGVRLEHDIFIHLDGTIEVTGGEEDAIVCLA